MCGVVAARLGRYAASKACTKEENNRPSDRTRKGKSFFFFYLLSFLLLFGPLGRLLVVCAGAPLRINVPMTFLCVPVAVVADNRRAQQQRPTHNAQAASSGANWRLPHTLNPSQQSKPLAIPLMRGLSSNAPTTPAARPLSVGANVSPRPQHALPPHFELDSERQHSRQLRWAAASGYTACWDSRDCHGNRSLTRSHHTPNHRSGSGASSAGGPAPRTHQPHVNRHDGGGAASTAAQHQARSLFDQAARPQPTPRCTAPAAPWPRATHATRRRSSRASA